MTTNTFPKMHVSLYVKDIEETVKFYNSFFGQEPEKIKPGYTNYILVEPALIISFIQSPEKARPHFGHLGFQVGSKEEMQKRLALAESQSIVSKKEMGTSCCYAVQDKFWVIDPDGVQWEVYYFHHDAEFNDPHYEIKTEEESCCTTSQTVEEVGTVVASKEMSCC